MMQTSVGTGTGLPREINYQPQNQNQGTYYSTQDTLLCRLINYRRRLSDLAITVIKIFFPFMGLIKEINKNVLNYFCRNQLCIASYLRITMEVLISHAL